MLNYEIRVVDIHDPKIKKRVKEKDFKGYGVIKLLSEIWDLRQSADEYKIKDVVVDLKEVLKGEDTILKVMEYLQEQTSLDKKKWKKIISLLNKEKLIKGEKIMDIRKYIEEKGVQKGLQAGRKAGMVAGKQAVVLNMLKKKMDFSLISEITGLSKEEIEKIKNTKLKG